jgi:arylsulfatase A-like enzyme
MIRRLLPILALGLLGAPAFAEAPRPNIIFVLTDDLGWGDLGVFYQNSRNFAVNRNLPAFVTPKLDTMAAAGLRMNRHYCPAPVCAPSRASLLLGVHQGHSNVRDNQFDKELADNHTLGTVLKQAGYATAAIGKWGLQGGTGFPSHPQNRGFDYFFGYMAHLDAHYHYPKEQGRAFYENFNNVAANLDKCYSTDLSVARAKKWISDHRTANPAQPFFIYLCFAAPHAQLNVPTGPYPTGGGLSGGVQWTGTPGAMINTATGTIDSWIHLDYASATWDHDNNSSTTEQAWPTTAKRHATMVRRIDDAMGDLLATLADLGIGNNTLVVFSSDNGPHNEAGSGGSSIGAQDPRFFRSYGPLDGIKRDVWEGGIRVPTLAHWPAGIPAGRISTHPSQFHDWMNTFAELAGQPAPFRSDGVSLVPDLTGTGSQRQGVVYVEYTNGGATSTPNYTDFNASHVTTRGHMQAVFHQGYKGIRYNTTAANTAFRVYDVAADPQETTNRAGQTGVPSQTALEARVAQVRRAGGGVSRVYDSVQIPPVTVPSTKPGLRFAAYEGSFPWVPDFANSTPAATGESTGIDLSHRSRANDVGLAYEGYLSVPTAGTYTFYLTTDTGAFVRLHDAQLVDADFGYSAGAESSSGTIPLAAGLHPIRIHYRHTTAASHSLTLQWQGPGITKQSIPAANFVIEGVPEPAPPTANDDTATTAFQTSVLIDVLANDSDDGTPSPLTISSVGTPSTGNAAIEDGKIRYTPPAGFDGAATFTYTITDGADTDSATVTVTVQPAAPITLWTTTFTGSDGTNRDLVITPGDPSFTDTLSADDANLTFQDTTFSGTVFMHSGTMASGTYYSPRTNVDNPGASSQNGGWWQSEFRYTGGSQTISLSDIVFRMVWSNSSGNLQAGDSSVRDITLTAESSLNGGANWTPISAPQTYNLTVNPGTAAEQHQNRTFTFASPLTVDYATQDLWLRLRAENAGGTAGAYVNVQSITFLGNVVGPPDDYSAWDALYPDTDLSDPAGDADSDGRTNFEEYAFGLDPADGASVSPVVAPDRAAGTFTYTRRKPSLTGLSYIYQSSTTLAGWTDFTPAGESSNNGGPVETITVTIPPALLAEPGLFLRVEANPP